VELLLGTQKWLFVEKRKRCGVGDAKFCRVTVLRFDCYGAFRETIVGAKVGGFAEPILFGKKG